MKSCFVFRAVVYQIGTTGTNARMVFFIDFFPYHDSVRWSIIRFAFLLFFFLNQSFT